MDLEALVVGDGTVAALSDVLVGAGWPKLGGVFDVFANMPNTVPAAAGVYAILIAEGGPLRYPMGSSHVMYIGEAHGAGGLRGRLGAHQHYAAQCRAEADGAIYYPRYEWINAAGGVCVYSAGAETSVITSQSMETRLIEAFRSIHYVLPLGNGQRGRQDRVEADAVHAADA